MGAAAQVMLMADLQVLPDQFRGDCVKILYPLAVKKGEKGTEICSIAGNSVVGQTALQTKEVDKLGQLLCKRKLMVTNHRLALRDPIMAVVSDDLHVCTSISACQSILPLTRQRREIRMTCLPGCNHEHILCAGAGVVCISN